MAIMAFYFFSTKSGIRNLIVFYFLLEYPTNLPFKTDKGYDFNVKTT